MIESFKPYTRVHFIGIGGIGISAIARMCIAEGKRVTGSDGASSHVTEGLEAIGATIHIGQSMEYLADDTDLVVYTIAIQEDNPELLKAKALGIPTLTYPESLSVFSKNKKTIAITGTHGKTTTTSMTARAMIACDLDPTVIVGSILKEWNSNFLGGTSEYFVVEGCEYRRSFLNLHPYILVITNIEADHLDYYTDLEDIKSAFRELALRVPRDGYLISDLTNETIKDVVADLTCTLIDYTQTDLLDLVLTKMPGEHNRNNAKAALSVVRALDGDMASARTALGDFSGVWRRFEYKGKAKTGAEVYDDYAHHPTEIRSFLSGAREKFANKKILAIFQPHLFSRTKDFLDDFGHAFEVADEILILPIYKAREVDTGEVSSRDVVNGLLQAGKIAFLAEDFDMAAKMVEEKTDQDWVVATIGAGETNLLAEQLVG